MTADVGYRAMGSICGTVKDAIDEMRDAGKRVGSSRFAASGLPA